MGWLGILCFVGFIMFAFWWTLYAKFDYESWVYTILWVFPLKMLSAILGWVLLTIIVSLIHCDNPKVIGDKREVSIYSIGLNNGIKGSFVLGTGSVEGEPVYRFFCKSNGGFKCYDVPAEHTTIIESDCNPHIVYIDTYRYNGEPNWLIRAYFGDNDAWRTMQSKDKIIYVPKGSIVQTFRLEP